MKTRILLFALASLAIPSLGLAQEPIAPIRQGSERQFVGDVVATDVPANTITVRATGVDAKGDPVDRTLTLSVDENLATRLASLKSGDKVTVLWRRDDANKRDLVVAIERMAPPPPEKS